jgi:hypothetical protein
MEGKTGNYNKEKKLNMIKLDMNFGITKFCGSQQLKSYNIDFRDIDYDRLYEFEGAKWKVKLDVLEVQDNEHAIDFNLTFKLVEGISKETNVGVNFAFAEWSRENYVLMPAAVYNGNRFPSRKLKYPPLVEDKDIGVNAPNVISDVPKLNIEEGESGIQLLTGDMATPTIGFYSPGLQKGFFMLTHQNTEYGESSTSIEENEDRSRAVINMSAPGVRKNFKYTMCTTKSPSDDRGADFNKGDDITLKFRIYVFECESIQSLFDYFVDIRKDLSGPGTMYHGLPFSSAWRIQEDKYNKFNWEDKHGYFSIGHRENIYQNWQIGWVGGMICTHPLLFEGSDISKERALKNFDFVFNYGMSPSGFFKSVGDGDNWYSDSFRDIINERWHLIRKSSDALYYILKQLMLMEKDDFRIKGSRVKVPSLWKSGIKRCADAFVTLWEKYGQFGQFVHEETGEIIVGGSASAGVAPAGLALAWQYFGDEKYLDTAKISAEYLYENFVKKGYTTGGPGEAVQCPDSESAFGLLESYTVLFEATGEEKWLAMAKDTANQCFTWCVSYDFNFPKNSSFGKLDMHTLGSVYANAQNKHSAPGVCTHSGVSLFKLYRATGDEKYLELIKEIAHNLTQYLSREDRPIESWDINPATGEKQLMAPGVMCERVNMCDWEGKKNVGEVFNGSCWCEVSNMLSYVEIPGLYVQTDTGFFSAIDHVDVTLVNRLEGKVTLKVYNPTKFKACVRVFVENSKEMKKILGQNALWGTTVIALEPGEDKEFTFKQ